MSNMDITQTVQAYLEIYKIFLLFLIPLDKIFQDKILMFIPTQLFNIFLDPNVFSTVVTNFVDKGQEMAILILTIPGSSCYTIGYRVGALERLMFDVTYRAPV